jgi:hypothetical protein
MFLMLASGSTNYLQKAAKIAQFSTKNAKKPRKTTKNLCFVSGWRSSINHPTLVHFRHFSSL